MGAGKTYIGDRDGLVVVTTQVLEQVLDEDRALGDLAVNFERLVVGGGKVDEAAGGLLGGRRHVCDDCGMW